MKIFKKVFKKREQPTKFIGAYLPVPQNDYIILKSMMEGKTVNTILEELVEEKMKVESIKDIIQDMHTSLTTVHLIEQPSVHIEDLRKQAYEEIKENKVSSDTLILFKQWPKRKETKKL